MESKEKNTSASRIQRKECTYQWNPKKRMHLPVKLKVKNTQKSPNSFNYTCIKP